MNITKDNFKHGLVPKRSERISLLGFPILALALCMIFAMTNSIRFPVVVKAKGAVIKSESRPEEYYITASFDNEEARQIQVGQNVRLLLNKYPADKYGWINGRVQSILLSHSDQCTVIARLPYGLVTDKNTPIPFGSGLNGDILIITKDLSVLQRMF